MIKCLNKYGVGFETVNPSAQIQRDVPLWHHPGQDRQKRQENNGGKAKCLRKNHGVITTGDGIDMTRRLDDPLHEENDSCACDACEEDRTGRGCKNPHACAKAAASRLRQLLPKWIP
ncbi:hypothetical protein B0H17DRAFT_900455, partial [Mycena rosella]